MLRSVLLSFLATALLVNSGYASKDLDGPSATKRPRVSRLDLEADWMQPSAAADSRPAAEHVFAVPLAPVRTPALLTARAANAHVELIQILGENVRASHYLMAATSLDAAGYHATDPKQKSKYYQLGIQHVDRLLLMKTNELVVSDLTLALSIYRGASKAATTKGEKLKLYDNLINMIQQKLTLANYQPCAADYISLSHYHSELAKLLSDAETKKGSMQAAINNIEVAIRFMGHQPVPAVYQEAARLCAEIQVFFNCTPEEQLQFEAKANLYKFKELIMSGRSVPDLTSIKCIKSLVVAGRAAPNGNEKHYYWSEGAGIANQMIARDGFEADAKFYNVAWACNWLAGMSTNNKNLAAGYLACAAPIKIHMIEKFGFAEGDLLKEAHDMMSAGINHQESRKTLFDYVERYITLAFSAFIENVTADHYSHAATIYRMAAPMAVNDEQRQRFLALSIEYNKKAADLRRSPDGDN